MEVLDTSIANVALPHIAGNLSASEDEATWVLTSYLVSNAIILPLSGWFSMLMGRRNFYMACVAMFTLSSFACGIAPTLGLLVFFRVLQGIGGGGLQPSEQAILADTFLPRQRGMAFAIYGIAVVTAPAIGPTLGGWITDNMSWRWIFFINIPVGILSLFLTRFMVDDPPYFIKERKQRKARGLRVDYWGIIFIAIGLGFLQILLDKGERDDWWASGFIRICAVLAASGLITAVWWELRQKDPVVDLSLLKDRNFAIAGGLMFMVGVVLLGSTVLIPQFLQLVMGYSATDAGMALSPGGLLVMCMLPFVGMALGKIEARWIIGFGPGRDVGRADSHDNLRYADGFPVCRDSALFPGGRSRPAIRADQHRGVCIRAAQQEQCGFRVDQSGAQRGRQRWYIAGDDDSGSAHAVPSGAADGQHGCLESGVRRRVAGSHQRLQACRHSGRQRTVCAADAVASAAGVNHGVH